MTLDFRDDRLAAIGLLGVSFEGVLGLTGRFTVFSSEFRPKLPLMRLVSDLSWSGSIFLIRGLSIESPDSRSVIGFLDCGDVEELILRPWSRVL